MKRLFLSGMLLAASQAWGQAPEEPADAPALCTPFVGYARDLLRSADEGNVATNDAMRGAALTTLGCAQSAIRLWSHRKADSELSATEKRFETGTATTVELGAARVAVAKATYCEAAFAEATRLAEIYERRTAVGLTGRGDIAPLLAQVEALIPVCGWSP